MFLVLSEMNMKTYRKAKMITVAGKGNFITKQKTTIFIGIKLI